MLRASRRPVDVRGSSTHPDGFFDSGGPVERADVGVAQIDLPIRYFRTDCFLAVFSADLEAVTGLMPSNRLHPVRLAADRVAVGVVAYNYLETGVGPYGEIGVAVLCTFGAAAPRVVPALLESRYPRFGAFVVHLPVTSRVACAAGRSVWGYPKFVSDMSFDLRPKGQRVELSEGGSDILGLEVARSGKIVRDNKPVVTYTVHDGDLLRTEVATRAIHHVGLGRSAGHLELGDHTVGRQLRELGISAEPIATKSYLSHSAILPRGRILARADRDHEGFTGSDREFGRHSIRYDNTFERVVSERSEQVPTPVSSEATAGT